MIARLFPITKDLLTNNRSTLFSDLIAGISIAVIVIPQGLAYAMIAGLPPIYGLYAALIPQLILGIMGTSRHPAVGPVALDSLVVAIALSALSLSGIEEVIAVAIFLATMVGVIFLCDTRDFCIWKAQKTTSTLASNWMARIEILTKCRYFCIFACIYN